MTLKLAPLPDYPWQEFDTVSTQRLGSQDWTEVCPVCRTLTMERIFNRLYCHTCDRRESRKETE